VVVSPIEAKSSHLEASDFPLDIMYQDDDVVVINKPAGLSMHPGAGNRSNTLANALVGHLVKGAEFEQLPERPGIVHRLDKDTTGVVVVARNVAAHTHLSEQFRTRSVSRAYKALVLRTPRARRLLDQSDSGTVDLNLDRDPFHRTRMAIVDEGGRRAVSHWHVLERMDYGALLDIKLETGRTHQIRVHMAAIQSPVIGDKVYGDFSALPAKLKTLADKFGRQALHAYRLEFDHPVSTKRLSFVSELPTDFEELIAAYRSLKG
jgi:23S rRNA pseudouridine1911/1915/1917 synthase